MVIYIDVAIGLIWDKFNRLLIAKKPYKDDFIWEFPGGKLEKGESIIHALKRELFEEVGIKIKTPQLLALLHGDDNSKFFRLFFCNVMSYSGIIKACENQLELRFVKIDEIDKYNLYPINKRLINLISILEK